MINPSLEQLSLVELDIALKYCEARSTITDDDGKQRIHPEFAPMEKLFRTEFERRLRQIQRRAMQDAGNGWNFQQ